MTISTTWMAKYVAGGDTALVNNIVFLWQNPCAATPSAYFQTLFPAAGEALITFLSFGWDDVLRGAVRPKGAYCGRRKQKKPRARPGILRQLLTDDVGNNIGKHIPGTKTIRARPTSSGVNFLWRADGVLQRGLFWWMVSDIVNDFFVNWSSGIIDGHCTPGLYDWEGSCYGNNSTFIPLVPIQDVTMPVDGSQVNCTAHLGAISWTGQKRGFAYGSLEVLNIGLSTSTFDLILWTDKGGGAELASEVSSPAMPGQRALCIVAAPVEGPQSVYLRMRPKTTTWGGLDAMIVASGTNF